MKKLEKLQKNKHNVNDNEFSFNNKNTINNLEVSIDVDLINLSFKEYRKIMDILIKEDINFKDISDILYLEKRKYHTVSTDYSKMDNNDIIRITKINIIG